METSMVSRSIISMSSKPLSARVLSSSHPMPPAPTMRTADRDEGGAGRVSVAGSGSDASKIRETRTFRILGELEIAHGRRHRGRQARTSRARRVLSPRERDHHLCCLGCARAARATARPPASTENHKKAVHIGYVSQRGRWSSSLTVDASLPVLRSSLRAPPRLAFTSASPATALWRSCRTERRSSRR